MNWHITAMDGVHQTLSEEEKEKRYQEINHFIENRGDNKIFAKKCFEFMNDCGLLTKECISILEDKKSREAIGSCKHFPELRLVNINDFQYG